MSILRGVAILGSTGSVGEHTLDVIARHPDRFRVIALGAHRSVEKLAEQCQRFAVPYAALADRGAARELETRLLNGYEVNGQTAWALLTKAERYRVCLISELPSDDVKRMRMTPVATIAEALEPAGDGEGFIMPRGAALLPRS